MYPQQEKLLTRVYQNFWCQIQSVPKLLNLPWQANVHSLAHHFNRNKNSWQIAQHTYGINLPYNFNFCKG
jgi:hypothetical protein